MSSGWNPAGGLLGSPGEWYLLGTAWDTLCCSRGDKDIPDHASLGTKPGSWGQGQSGKIGTLWFRPNLLRHEHPCHPLHETTWAISKGVVWLHSGSGEGPSPCFRVRPMPWAGCRRSWVPAEGPASAHSVLRLFPVFTAKRVRRALKSMS